MKRTLWEDTLARACDAAKDVACAREAFGKLLRLDPSTLPPDVVEHARARAAALK